MDGTKLFRTLCNLLSEGRPVSIARLAEALGRPGDEMDEAIGSQPDIEFDGEGRIVGAGLTLEPTRHRFRLGDTLLYTWCAWDALIYPSVLDRTAKVESTCASTGAVVRLTVTPNGIENPSPPEAVLSLPKASLAGACENVRSEFCSRSNFFSSASVAREWLDDRDEVEIMSVSCGYRLASRCSPGCGSLK